MIILKTYEGKICGGFTTKSWGNGSWDKDKDAFVFNMENKYTPKQDCDAIYSYRDGGFLFGNCALKLFCDPLNVVDGGECNLYGDYNYNIEQDSEGNNPLTGKKINFTCIKLEVFRIFFDTE